MSMNALEALASMSNAYGADPAYVLAGGGNTSYKNGDTLWIKGSGTSLATIRSGDFVQMDRQKLQAMWDTAYPSEDAARESAVLADMMAARVPGEERRPSVETLLHDLFPKHYVLHVHPALVNGLTCGKNGEQIMKQLFPEAVWVAACRPGYILAQDCREKMLAFEKANGKSCCLLFLQNHGIFFAGDTVAEVDALAAGVMGKLAEFVEQEKSNKKEVAAVASVLKALYAEGGEAAVAFTVNADVLAYDPATKSLSPDHIVYAKARQLALPREIDQEGIRSAFSAFVAENDCKPKIVFVDGMGMFSCGTTEAEAKTAQVVMLDAIRVVGYAQAFGGVSPMEDDLIDFIVNWEVESYRSKVSNKG